MKHAILIIAHKDTERVLQLVNWFDDDFDIYIHMDKKNRLTHEERERLDSHPRIKFVSQKYRIYWGGINFLKSILWLSKMACMDSMIDYIHVISGVDFPVRNILNFKTFFENNRGCEFLDYFSLPSKRWEEEGMARLKYFALNDFMDVRTETGGRKMRKFKRWQKRWHIQRKIPTCFPRLYGGSNWWSLSRECVSYVVKYTRQHPRFLRRLYFTFAPDEMYFQTILLNSPYEDKIVNNNLRYIIWIYKNGGQPANLDSEDLGPIVLSGNYFARKFELPYAQELMIQLTRINQNILSIQSKYITNKQMLLDQIAKYLSEQGDKGIFNGLLYGRLGITIFLFHYAQFTNKDGFYEKACNWLEQIVENIGTIHMLDYADGITGIGVGIEYLHVYGMIDDNTNEILEEMDSLALRLADRIIEHPRVWREYCLDKYFMLRTKNRFGLSYQQRQVFERLALQLKRETKAGKKSYMSLNDYIMQVNMTNLLGIAGGYAGVGLQILAELSEKPIAWQELLENPY